MYKVKNKIKNKLAIFMHVGTTVVHSGQEDAYLVEGLEPYTEYSFRLRLLHGCDKSPFSAVVMARTLEGGWYIILIKNYNYLCSKNQNNVSMYQLTL